MITNGIAVRVIMPVSRVNATKNKVYCVASCFDRRFSSLICLMNILSLGFSAKINTTGWPCSSRSLRTLPFTPLQRKSGAGRGTEGLGGVDLDFDVWPSRFRENEQHTTARRQIQRRFIPS